MTKRATSKRSLRDGDVIEIHRDDGELRAMVVSVDAQQLELVVKAALEPGEELAVSRTVADDARYTSRIEVSEVKPGRCRAGLKEPWERVQAREYVRVPVYTIAIGVEPEVPEVDVPDERSARLARLQENLEGRKRKPRLVDLSAGGLCFESNDSHEPGEMLLFDFSLPQAGPVRVRGRVCRAHAADEKQRLSNRYGVAFEDLEETVRVQIMTWVFSEQARRFRHEKEQVG